MAAFFLAGPDRSFFPREGRCTSIPFTAGGERRVRNNKRTHVPVVHRQKKSTCGASTGSKDGTDDSATCTEASLWFSSQTPNLVPLSLAACPHHEHTSRRIRHKELGARQEKELCRCTGHVSGNIKQLGRFRQARATLCRDRSAKPSGCCGVVFT